MKPAIHLLDPVKGKDTKWNYITTRCGYLQHEDNPYKAKTTTNPTEVTCIKCKSYINNPYRVMRKYGKVKVVESFYVLLWADYGYKLDMVAVLDVPGAWAVKISFKNNIHYTRTIWANNMADLGFQLLAIYEKEIVEIASSIQNPATSILHPVSSIQNPTSSIQL